MDNEILERDLIQARLLSAIFARSVKNQVVLKGGMALRALFGSQRYTKDIDLSQDPSQPLPSLQRLMRHAITECTQGFLSDITVTEPKQTDTVARWKIHGTTQSGTHIGLTVEVSRRGVPDGHVIQKTLVGQEQSRSPTVNIDVYDAESIAASKVFALASDNRVAPRDLYDLDLLIKMDVRPSHDLFVSVPDSSALIKATWNKIESMTWDHFAREVLPYIPDSAKSRMDESQFDSMRISVGSAIEKWLSPGM